MQSVKKVNKATERRSKLPVLGWTDADCVAQRKCEKTEKNQIGGGAFSAFFAPTIGLKRSV